MSNRFPKSIRKFIRQEKARIHRQFLDVAKKEEEIAELYKKLGEMGYNKGNKEIKKVEDKSVKLKAKSAK